MNILKQYTGEAAFIFQSTNACKTVFRMGRLVKEEKKTVDFILWKNIVRDELWVRKMRFLISFSILFLPSKIAAEKISFTEQVCAMINGEKTLNKKWKQQAPNVLYLE